MKKSLVYSSILFAFLFFSKASFANTITGNAPDKTDPILEITDKFNEVKLGLTKDSVYMIFSENALSAANQNFKIQNEVNTQNFEDSEGKFITGSVSYLTSNRIEYKIEDISGINFTNGKLSFSYKTKSEIGFEDIFAFDGTKAINNFYVEDLEDFIFTFTNSLKS